MSKYKAIAIFGSASDEIDPSFRKPVFETAAMLAQNGITMIYKCEDLLCLFTSLHDTAHH